MNKVSNKIYEKILKINIDKYKNKEKLNKNNEIINQIIVELNNDNNNDCLNNLFLNLFNDFYGIDIKKITNIDISEEKKYTVFHKNLSDMYNLIFVIIFNKIKKNYDVFLNQINTDYINGMKTKFYFYFNKNEVLKEFQDFSEYSNVLNYYKKLNHFFTYMLKNVENIDFFMYLLSKDLFKNKDKESYENISDDLFLIFFTKDLESNTKFNMTLFFRFLSLKQNDDFFNNHIANKLFQEFDSVILHQGNKKEIIDFYFQYFQHLDMPIKNIKSIELKFLNIYEKIDFLIKLFHIYNENDNQKFFAFEEVLEKYEYKAVAILIINDILNTKILGIEVKSKSIQKNVLDFLGKYLDGCTEEDFAFMSKESKIRLQKIILENKLNKKNYTNNVKNNKI